MDIARSSLKLFLSNLIGSAAIFLGITYFARELGPTPIGVFFLFEALLGMLSIPIDFDLRGAVEKRISEGESQGEFLASGIFLKLVPITVVVLGIWLLKEPLNNYLGEDLAIFLAAAIVLQEAAQLSIFVLKGELRVGETATLKLVRQTVWIGVSTILVSFGWGTLGIIWGLLAGFCLMLIWGWYKCSVSLERPSKQQARSLLHFSKYNVISSIGGYFYSWMDVAIIGLFLTQAHVGTYEVAWRVTAVVVLLSTAIADTVFPQVSQWNSNGAKSRIESVIREAITPSLALVIPSFFGVLIFSQDILRLVFGNEFAVAWLVLIILMGEKILQSVHKIFGRSLLGIDCPDLAAYATVVSVMVNLLLNIVLIPIFGILGAAIATTASFSLNTFLHGFFLSKYVTIDIPYVEIGWLVLASIGMTLCLKIAQSFVAIETLPQLVFVITLGSFIYFLLVLLYSPLRMRLMSHIRSPV
jgi:O-antigen/teichoic acid export membrane protein